MFEELKGGAQSASIKIDETGARLPKQAARFVMLSNHNVTDAPNYPLKPSVSADNTPITPDTVEAAAQPVNNEIYFGFGSVYAHQLFAGQSTVLLPCSDLSQICLRTRPNQTTTVFYTWFW